MQNCSIFNRCAQVLFIPGELLQRFRHTPEQKIVAVPVGYENQEIELLMDSKHHMEIANVQKVGLLCVNPSLLGDGLALWTVTIVTLPFPPLAPHRQL